MNLTPLEALHVLNALMLLGPAVTRDLISELDHRQLMAIAHNECTIITRHPGHSSAHHQPMQIAG